MQVVRENSTSLDFSNLDFILSLNLLLITENIVSTLHFLPYIPKDIGNKPSKE
jgi:hypothetical protein